MCVLHAVCYILRGKADSFICHTESMLTFSVQWENAVFIMVFHKTAILTHLDSKKSTANLYFNVLYILLLIHTVTMTQYYRSDIYVNVMYLHG